MFAEKALCPVIKLVNLTTILAELGDQTSTV